MPNRPPPPFDPNRSGRELIAHVLRGRYAVGLGAIADRILADAYREVAAILRDSTLDRGRRDTQLALVARVRTLLGSAYRSTRERIEADLAGFVLVEADFARFDLAERTGVDVVSGLTRQSLRSIAALPIEGATLGEWYEGQARAMSDAVRRQIQVGMVLGEGPAAIARRIVNSDPTLPAIDRRARRDARTVARTAVTAVQTHAATETYIANADIVRGVRISSIFDSRTSVICASLDHQKVWRLDDPRRPILPLHPNCRSSYTSVIDWGAAGLSAPADDSAPTARDYADWLREQGPMAQDSILGAARAEMWRTGKVTLQDLVGSDMRPLTLEQLRAKYGALMGTKVAA